MKKQSTWFWTEKIKGNKVDKTLTELLETRHAFQKILENSTSKNIVEALLGGKTLSKKMAIMHLMRASDCSAETLDRIKTYIQNKELDTLHIKRPGDTDISYRILQMNSNDINRLNNKKIQNADTDLLKDMMTIMLFGSMIEEFKDFTSIKKLDMGEIIGDKIRLRSFFTELYLKVSSQTKGKESNSSGDQLAKFIRKQLQAFFKDKSYFSFVDGNRIPNVGPDPNGLQVDIACKIKTPKKEAYIAIEIAFQETTNSVIERKSKQATELRESFDKAGSFLCFVADGGGYFTREKALRDIVKYSHKTVTIKQRRQLYLFIDEIHNS